MENKCEHDWAYIGAGKPEVAFIKSLRYVSKYYCAKCDTKADEDDLTEEERRKARWV